MMKELRFYKKGEDHLVTWWLDSPEFIKAGGDPSQLQMVAGADDLLAKLSDGKGEVTLGVSEDKVINGLSYISALRRVDEIPTTSGRYYHDDDYEMIIWLCDVTKWVFNGRFPETIWYKKV